jgi:hypothetical protein
LTNPSHLLIGKQLGLHLVDAKYLRGSIRDLLSAAREEHSLQAEISHLGYCGGCFGTEDIGNSDRSEKAASGRDHDLGELF